MDMFIDKLAQRFNAQEIIQANTAAETEELNRLKSRITEYNECLDKLRELIKEGEEKFQGQAQAEQISQLVAESLAKIQAVTPDAGQLLEIEDRINALGTQIAEKLASTESAMKNATEEAVKSATEEAMKAAAEEAAKTAETIKALREELKPEEHPDATQWMNERILATEEYMHKESVKVYRNVQAVINEAAEKQTAENAEAVKEAKKARKKASVAVCFAILAFLSSAAGLTLQILGLLNIELF